MVKKEEVYYSNYWYCFTGASTILCSKNRAIILERREYLSVLFLYLGQFVKQNPSIFITSLEKYSPLDIWEDFHPLPLSIDGSLKSQNYEYIVLWLFRLFIVFQKLSVLYFSQLFGHWFEFLIIGLFRYSLLSLSFHLFFLTVIVSVCWFQHVTYILTCFICV